MEKMHRAIPNPGKKKTLCAADFQVIMSFTEPLIFVHSCNQKAGIRSSIPSERQAIKLIALISLKKTAFPKPDLVIQ